MLVGNASSTLATSTKSSCSGGEPAQRTRQLARRIDAALPDKVDKHEWGEKPYRSPRRYRGKQTSVRKWLKGAGGRLPVFFVSRVQAKKESEGYMIEFAQAVEEYLPDSVQVHWFCATPPPVGRGYLVGPAQTMLDGSKYPWPEDVQRGVAWLDTHVPGWAERIRLDRLDIGGQYSCILGQLFGSYDSGLCVVEQGETWAIAHGFTVRRDLREGDALGEAPIYTIFNYLTALWYTIIATRRDEKYGTFSAGRPPGSGCTGDGLPGWRSSRMGGVG